MKSSRCARPGCWSGRPTNWPAALVKPGATTGEIDAAVEKFFLEHNAIPLFKGVPGKVPFPAVTCISVNEEVVHGIPGPRVLHEGDVVSIDTGCKLDGWCGDSAVTHPVGKIAPEVQRLLDVTSGVLELAIDLMGHKRRWSEVATEMGTYVRDAGFAVVESFVGHGIGREMHEDPQVPNFVSAQFRRNGDFPTRAGAGHRRRADGQHGDQAGQGNARPLDPGHAGRQAQCPLRAHDRHDRRRALGVDRRPDEKPGKHRRPQITSASHCRQPLATLGSAGTTAGPAWLLSSVMSRWITGRG